MFIVYLGLYHLNIWKERRAYLALLLIHLDAKKREAEISWNTKCYRELITFDLNGIYKYF